MSTEKTKNAILHISDLHIGPKTKKDNLLTLLETSETGYTSNFFDHLSKRLEDEKAELIGVVISGDLSDKGREIDYKDVYQFLSRLVIKYKLLPNKIFITPGNHDINWLELEAFCYNRNISIDNNHNEIRQFNKSKFSQFTLFYDDFYLRDIQPRNLFDSDRVIIRWDEIDPINGLSVMCINSCHNCGLDGENKGYIDEFKLKSELSQFKDIQKNKDRNLFSIVLLHHVLWLDPTKNEFSIINWKDIHPIFESFGINAYFSGHIHNSMKAHILSEDITQVVAPCLGKYPQDIKAAKEEFNETNGYCLIIYPKETRESDKLLLKYKKFTFDQTFKDKRHDFWFKEDEIKPPKDQIELKKILWDKIPT